MFKKKSIFLLFLISFCFAHANEISTETLSNDDQIEITTNDDIKITDESIYDVPQEYKAPSFTKAFIKMIIVLIIIIALVIATFWSLKRLNKVKIIQANNTKSIKIIEKRALSPKSVLYLVEVDNERVLISESQFEVRPIQALEMHRYEDNT